MLIIPNAFTQFFFKDQPESNRYSQTGIINDNNKLSAISKIHEAKYKSKAEQTRKKIEVGSDA